MFAFLLLFPSPFLQMLPIADFVSEAPRSWPGRLPGAPATLKSANRNRNTARRSDAPLWLSCLGVGHGRAEGLQVGSICLALRKATLLRRLQGIQRLLLHTGLRMDASELP